MLMDNTQPSNIPFQQHLNAAKKLLIFTQKPVPSDVSGRYNAVPSPFVICLTCRGQPIPGVEYTAEETVTWGTALRELAQLYPRAACREFLTSFPAFHFSPHRVPQLQELSQVSTLMFSASARAFLVTRVSCRLQNALQFHGTAQLHTIETFRHSHIRILKFYSVCGPSMNLETILLTT